MEQDYNGPEKRKKTEHICTKEEQIDEISDDVTNIKSDINTIKNDKIHTNELLTNIQKQLYNIDKRLFIDNGTLSIQSLLKNGENRMSNLETSIHQHVIDLNKKINAVEELPAKYLKYTIGFIGVLTTLCGLIIYLVKHA